MMTIILVSPADGLITDISERSGPEELETRKYNLHKSKYFYECI